MGFGKIICDFVGAIFKNNGNWTYIRTVNPALGEAFNNSLKWKGTGTNGKGANLGKETRETGKHAANRKDRISYSHEYIGDALSGYEELLLSTKDLRKQKKLNF
jgi:hypothetical protein